MKSNNWCSPTRFLHLGLVLTVSAQLIISLLMTTPDHTGTAFSKFAFDAHEVVGLLALGIVIMHWIWSIFSQADGGLSHLFPVSKQACSRVIKDVNNLKQAKLPATNQKGGLIGLIHGLGFLAVTGIASTGAVLFVIFPETGEPGVLAETFAEMHEAIATLVWTYWIGHGGMALIHHFKGEAVLKNMFSFKNRDKATKKIGHQLKTQHRIIHKH